MIASATLIVGDARGALASLEPASVHGVVTSPPYFRQRDYGHPGQLGQESDVDHYAQALVDVFREVRRVLRDDGTVWLNLGDGYHHRQLLGAPWRVAFALQADGWCLRQDVVWHKPAPMPEPARDRCTRAHEYLFLLAKSPDYHFDAVAVQEPGQNSPRNRRSVWKVPNTGYRGAHFAVMPAGLIEPCILASIPAETCPDCGAPYARQVERHRVATRPGRATKTTGDDKTEGHRDPLRHVTTTTTLGFSPTCRCPPAPPTPGVVLDPFCGSGTVLEVAARLGRRSIGIELNPDYAKLTRDRLTPRAPRMEENHGR